MSNYILSTANDQNDLGLFTRELFFLIRLKITRKSESAKKIFLQISAPICCPCGFFEFIFKICYEISQLFFTKALNFHIL